ncbi:hypothetical protein QPK87_27530 [Kamptonema cortianum]|nr:hypothetical protein [Oscillatoria laete-virens]MDK3160282.1 hypothetical protein [Kamptonema cortianum]MDL5053667.1 hypothetical protein [Oscillatoria laete-virens NRMC-F 0139]
MNFIQWLTLNILSAVLAVLVLASLLLANNAQNLSRQVATGQQTVQMARQSEVLLRQLSLRIAQASDSDPSMRSILSKYGLKVTVPRPDGTTKTYE